MWSLVYIAAITTQNLQRADARCCSEVGVQQPHLGGIVTATSRKIGDSRMKRQNAKLCRGNMAAKRFIASLRAQPQPIFRFYSIAAPPPPPHTRTRAGLSTALGCHPKVFSNCRAYSHPGHHDHARLCVGWGQACLGATAAGCRVQNRHSWNDRSEGAESCAAAAAGCLRGIEIMESLKLSV